MLPEYMVPSAFVTLERMPLTPNGKLDRRALPAPQSYASEGYEAPQGGAEEAIAGIWQELLRVERVGRHDNFFDLGGHSLLATRVISRLREVLHVEMPVRALFDTPTLEQLAGRVSDFTSLDGELRSEIDQMADDAVFARIAELEKELAAR
jgi:hypothetical protein